MNDAMYGHAFYCTQKIGNHTLSRLKRYFGSFENAWHGTLHQFREARIQEPVIQSIFQSRLKMRLDHEEELLHEHEIELIARSDPRYPLLLSEIPNAPELLYARGNSSLMKKMCLGVVGTRKPSAYGKQAISNILPAVLGSDIAIVSGLALGIDGLAHEITLNNNGAVIAVLGSGLSFQALSPKTNLLLAKKILANNGLLISEYPLFCGPQKHYFPLRNRIIAGLSKGVLIVEAAHRSGALITAYLGLEYNREIMAIPGNIGNFLSVGTNNLIKRGAKCVTCGQDVLDALQLYSSIKLAKQIDLSHNEQQIFSLLVSEPKSIDEIIILTGFSPSEVFANLTTLELKNTIYEVRPQVYSRKLF